MPEYAIGATAAGLEDLEALGLPWPRAEVVDYAEYVENGEGDLVGQGWLMCRWRFDVLESWAAAVLEAYEGDCYIRTLRQDNSYGTYSARLVRSPRRAPKVGQIFDYVIEFRKLTVV